MVKSGLVSGFVRTRYRTQFCDFWEIIDKLVNYRKSYKFNSNEYFIKNV